LAKRPDTPISRGIAMNTALDSTRFLTTKELSKLLGIAEGTLRQWRCSKVGPKWHKLRGSVRYDKTDVENFLHESERIPSVRAHMEEHLVSVSSQR
jgi:predicted DNA-binding transcriptional regulator AlpA